MENVYRRAQDTKRMLKNYINQNELGDDQKVVIVAHYTFLR